MKTYVINLDHRNDRMNRFNENQPDLDYERISAVDGQKVKYQTLLAEGFDVDHDWIDPILHSKLTKGEIGCFLSHYEMWNRCIQMNESIIILEDDAILSDRFNMEEIESLPYDFVYLAYHEMGERIKLNDTFSRPVYPYWTLAYMIRPEAARILVNDFNTKRKIFPVDEYLPTMMESLNVAGYTDNVVTPVSRSVQGSNVIPFSRYDYFLSYKVHPITVGTDHDRCERLITSGLKKGIEFENIAKGQKWVGGDMANSTGGGQKINLIKNYIRGLPNNDIVFFCDGYDVFVVDHIDEFLYRYSEINHKVVFAAEQFCWPVDNAEEQKALVHKHSPHLDTKYKYLNSGVFIGRVSELKKIFKDPIDDDGDDQLYCQQQYLSEKYDMVIDTDCYMFQCYEEEVYPKKGLLFNTETRCYNLLFHGNGGDEAKQKLNELYTNFYPSSSPIVLTHTHKYDKLRDDILLIDYLTPSMCDSLIELSERHGGYRPDEGDKVPAQEIRLKELELFDIVSQHWEEHVAPLIDEEFQNCPCYGVRDAFVIKYDIEGQRTLPLHSDASLVTGSIKLNDNYTGGELYFPRQHFSNKDVPVGKCILFPSQVSHPHKVNELLSGTKLSLTIWTKRSWND